MPATCLRGRELLGHEFTCGFYSLLSLIFDFLGYFFTTRHDYNDFIPSPLSTVSDILVYRTIIILRVSQSQHNAIAIAFFRGMP